jgi:glucuronoarabinoxylan endo-1,4-beta-xylanase
MHQFNRLCAVVVGGVAVMCGMAMGVPVTVDEQTEYQTILGFGGNDPNSDAATLVNDLGLSAHRAWLDATGSSSPSWSVMKQMKDLGVSFFIACPWSPPPALKYNNNEAGTDSKWNRLSNGIGPLNDFQHPDRDTEKGAMGNMYPAWATHMANWIHNFKVNVGVDLNAICPQNEPAFAEPYSSCVYNAYQLRDAVGYLGDTMAARGYTATKIAVGDGMLGNFSGDNFAGAVMGFSDNYTAVAKYVSLINVHGYGSNGATPYPSTQAALAWNGAAQFCAANSVRNVVKKKLGLMMTETSGYQNWTGGTSPDDGSQEPGSWALAIDIYNALKYGKIQAWFWWRLSVTSSGWVDEALMLNHSPLKTYYVSKNFYKYIRPGAVHIKCDATSDTTIWPIAFNDKANQKLVVVALNTGTVSKSITFSGSNMPTSFQAYRTSSSENCVDVSSSAVSGQNITLPANTITTIVGANYNPPPVGVSNHETAVGIASRLGAGCRAAIFDLSGRLVRVLGEARPGQGSALVAWDGRDNAGRMASRGSYYAVVSDASGNKVVSKTTVEIR